jgi:hypothetical protein
MVLGWWLLPLVLLASMLMLATALIVNNGLGRRFPVYWWTPVDLHALRERRRNTKIEEQGKDDVERGLSETSTEAVRPSQELKPEISHDTDRTQAAGAKVKAGEYVLLTKDRMMLPDSLHLSDMQYEVLEILMEKLREGQSPSQ